MERGLKASQQKLVEEYSDLVTAVLWSSIAKNTNYSSFDYEDLIQEGNLALCKASKSYTEGKGTTFKTYAWSCIKNAMFTSLTKINKYQKDCFFEDIISLDSEDFIWNHIAALELREALENIRKKSNDHTTKIGIDALIFQSEGLSVKDIGQKMEKAPNYIRACCSRARQKIQKDFGKEENN